MISTSGIVPLPYRPEELPGLLGENGSHLLDSAYHWMILGRTLDSRMQALQRQGRVGFYGAATGQEAVSVGAALSSAAEDWVFPGLREQLVALVRGHSLTTYVHHLFANGSDPARGRQMPCHPTAREVNYVSMSSVIGTQVSQAVGLAYALRYKQTKGVALAFFGDGATSANDFHAGLNFAGVLSVPVVFCCTNNQWAISVPVERQTAIARLSDKASAYGFGGLRVDGTDVVAVMHSVRTSLDQARTTRTPSLIEFVIYRMTPHSTSDDPTRYQPADWTERALAHDPVLRLEDWLRRHGRLDETMKQSIAEECDQEVREAIRVAEATPPPAEGTLFEDVFAEVPGVLPGRGR